MRVLPVQDEFLNLYIHTPLWRFSKKIIFFCIRGNVANSKLCFSSLISTAQGCVSNQNFT
jgi:hypothetical protein